jgi:hypothetical protein
MSVWIPLLSAFVGTILGGLVSIVTAFKIEEHKRNLEGRAVTLAILTEIRVMISLIEIRGYLKDLEKTLADLRAGTIRSSTFEIQFTQDQFPIFSSNRDKIGLLPVNIMSDVVRFYMLLEAAIADVRPGGLLAANECGEKEFAALLNITGESLRLGRNIVAAYPEGDELTIRPFWNFPLWDWIRKRQ